MEAVGESGVLTERIVGVSMGSLVGGLYAVRPDIHHAQAATMRLLYSPIFSQKCDRLVGTASRVSRRGTTKPPENRDWMSEWFGRLERLVRTGHRLKNMMRGPAILTNEILQEAIDTLIPDIDIGETEIPMSIVAVDLRSGHKVVIERGSLRQAILASTAIPGLFEPVEWEGHLLCDVGVLDSLPLKIAKSYATDLTIGVDVGAANQRHEHFETAFEVMLRMEEIGERICRRNSSHCADVLIRPKLGQRQWYDFSAPEDVIKAGRSAARASLNIATVVSERDLRRLRQN
jgi:NTE family protein